MSQVYTHPVSGETILQILRSLLPYSIPLYERLRFYRRSSTSHCLATFPSASTDPDSNSIPKCFAIAFIDRSRRPETECWIFLSGEVPGHCSLSSVTASCADCRAALLSLVREISNLDVPDSVHDLQRIASANVLLSHVLDSNILLIGTLHESCMKIIRDAGFLAVGHPGADIPYMKYIFRSDTLPDCTKLHLPASLGWGPVLPQHFDLVRKRTQIPRQNATLAILPSLCLSTNAEPSKGIVSEPVAWAFLGQDGSLTSLHTEEEYRGKGFAKMLGTKLFKEGGYTVGLRSGGRARPAVSFERDVYYHADVALGNGSSRAVCRALGGTELWIDFWIRVNLAAVRSPESH